jgi:phosphate starvation-inducible membrane PsiE
MNQDFSYFCYRITLTSLVRTVVMGHTFSLVIVLAVLVLCIGLMTWPFQIWWEVLPNI